MSTDLRRYRLKARADRQLQTRARIVAATEALHREVGPARTTIADIARRAGVQRLTVYNHFGAVDELLAACQSSFLEANPPPDIGPSGPRRGSLDRLERALLDLYHWYRTNEAMQHNIHRDRQLVPELDELLRRTADPRLDATATAYSELIAGEPAAAAPVRLLIQLALEFGTWELLASRGASDQDIAMLFRRAVSAEKSGMPGGPDR